MTPILYALNIGTLATWLSVASFGTIGIAVPVTMEIINDAAKDPYDGIETIALTDAFTPDEPESAQNTDTGNTGEMNSDQTDVPFAEQETLPTPPEMPETAEVTPLPEVPDMPEPSPSSTAPVAAAPTKPRPVAKTNSRVATRSNMPTNATGGSPQGKVGATGKIGNGGMNGGSGMSDAKRIANGRMSKPPYPRSMQDKGQGGTVGIELVVDGEGRVIQVKVTQPCPWPELNECTRNHVMRSWKFSKTGNITKFSRAIKFVPQS